MTDVDATWDGKGSLDEHRQNAFKDMKQPGFGGPVKPPAAPPQPEPSPAPVEDAE